MKFSERTSNQSTLGHLSRMWAKWTVRRPTPTPRPGRWKRLPKRISPVWKRHLRKEKGEEATWPPPHRTTLRKEGDYRPLQPLLPLQELLPALSLMCSAFTGTEHPPLPLQEFLPAQPLSPGAQPPRPLQS